ncbi:MAG: TetR/AcrR family transcriptional regulator [Eubacterium sp.]
MDIRIIRTKKMINDALLELIREKPIEKITPTELCRRATINRNTFYSHYSSTAEVLEGIEDELFNTVDESLNESKTPTEAITILCKMLKANQKLSNLLFSKNAGARIMKRVFDITNKFNMNKMNTQENNLSDTFKQMLSSYTIMGSAAALECWVKNGMNEKPEDIAEFIFNISKYGSSAVTK